MIGAMLWIQDCYTASDVPRHEDFDDDTLLEALSLEKVRKTDIDMVDINTTPVYLVSLRMNEIGLSGSKHLKTIYQSFLG
jgi:hypothetical protein